MTTKATIHETRRWKILGCIRTTIEQRAAKVARRDEEEVYACWGSVRGWCGHVHHTEEAAEECQARDHRACQRHAWYSDLSTVIISVTSEEEE